MRARLHPLVLCTLVLATGCAQIPREPLVHQPMTARANTYAALPAPRANGAIFRDGPGANALFEDRRPRNVGDILTIVISEKVNASKNSGANASRSGSLTAAFWSAARSRWASTKAPSTSASLAW
jgi:flagellar L-ring protein precursor FlgH